eukprot:14527894-Alexandrium_andersonii.AAC.1
MTLRSHVLGSHVVASAGSYVLDRPLASLGCDPVVLDLGHGLNDGHGHPSGAREDVRHIFLAVVQQ